MFSRAVRLCAPAVVSLLVWCSPILAATVPSGFTETLITAGLQSPTTMQFAPDGRLFVLEQGGTVRIVSNGVLLPAPFATLAVDDNGERGLLGIAFDPDFATNHFVYLYYTVAVPLHNRVIRVTANGDVAVPGSDVTILDLDPLFTSLYHNGGAMAFGPDGKLYIGVGENVMPQLAQDMTTRLGKMLRINADGSIPTDNPFYDSASGANRAIWALGLRNPNNFAFNPGGPAPAMIINDVGEQSWEEVNPGAAGANYGWPLTEGDFDPGTFPQLTRPRYAYFHSDGCAIVGGGFYAPATPTFPAAYNNAYFFADYCSGWIRSIDPTAPVPTAQPFAAGIASPVDVKIGPDGGLYYLARASGSVYRVQYGSTGPGITTQPADLTVRAGQTATFSVTASGTGLSYQWQRAQQDIPGAISSTYSFTAQAGDDGARFRVRVSNGGGNVISNDAVLTVSSNQRPTATITAPVAGTTYGGGQTITYAGTGTDAEDGALGGSAFTWQIDFHHDTHIHPFLPATSGATGGAVVIPATGHTETNVWYRIHLTVTDSDGATHEVFRDVTPRVVQLTLTSTPANRPLLLDSQPVTAPHIFSSVEGIVRNIEAQDHADAGVNYAFLSWSDGGAARHDLATPTADTTYTASFTVTSAPIITTPPASQAVVAGGTATFSVVASGNAPLTYQWQRNGADIAGATASTYVVSPAQLADDGALFRVRVANGAGSVDSSAALLTVTDAPPTGPVAPTGFLLVANGATLAASWTQVAGAIGYRLEVGSAPAAADVANLAVGDVAMVQGLAPPGLYYARVRAIHPSGVSAPSAERVAQVTTTASCVAPPPAPGAYSALTGGLVVDMRWAPSPFASSYVLEVGSAPGATDLLRAPLGNVTRFVAEGPAGAYYARIRAANACGESVPASEVPVVLGCAASPIVPSGLTATTAGGVATFTWQAPVGALGYRLHVGTAPGLSNVLDTPIGAVTALSVPLTGVPGGAYYVRVAAISSCGVGAPSNEVQVVVP